ncbi:MAG: carbohydrate binding family 9 domain-containing protein [Gemmatimonadetes bacterium]|nr:carbohydrate binding family 9 domain-containing protein [Gemmatimonadota bacterium]
MRTHTTHYLLLSLIGLAPAVAAAQSTSSAASSASTREGVNPARPVVTAVPVSGTIRIDGRLDEAAWAAAKPVTAFTQVDPEEGKPVSERTEARILFDHEAIYVGMRLYDRQPPTIRLGRRDMALLDADWVGVVFDSYHDHRTAFSFDLNPAGVQRDETKSMSASGQEQDDNSWDAVWEGKTTVDSLGWTAEYRIPFSQLRFSETKAPVWGIQLERIIGRRREYDVLSFTPKSEPGGIPTYGTLVGLRDIAPGNRLEVLPYAVARMERINPGPDPFRSNSEQKASAGVDLLFRATSDFTVNASFNPDFGQVEADPAVVNLTVYETQYEEKRPFFIEGSEIFDFGRNTSGGQLFYTRRIGRAPQLRAPTAASDAPANTTILGAAKMSGKTPSGWSLGVIEAVTGREQARYLTSTGAEDLFTVEPLTNYLVARARKDTNGGRTSVGGMFTAVDRRLDTDPLRAALRSSAYAGGADFRLESASRLWVLRGSAAYSRVAGSPEAMVATQTAGIHFFQRPDATHLGVDPNATSLTGYSVGAAVERQGGRHWRGGFEVAATSPAFEVNDLGFQYRTDRRDGQATLNYVENQPGSFLRNYAVSGTVRYEHNYDWQRIQALWALTGQFRTLNFWSGYVSVRRSVRAVDDRSTRGGPLMQRPANWSVVAHLSTDPRKSVTISSGVGGDRDEYGGWTATIGADVGVKTSSRWNLTVGPSYARSLSKAQYVGTVPDAAATATYGAWYLFAPLRQTTVSMETRLNLTFTPRLSFQLYAQPFIASGDYLTVGSLDTPRGYTFTPYPGQVPNLDFNYRSLRGTAVLRWEWRPGSTLYAAWQQSRADYASGVGNFDFSRDRSALFNARPDNVFVLKMNYWFTP